MNSVALQLLAIEQGLDFESVFVDHGADLPTTYEYMAMLIGKGYLITVIKPDVTGVSDLYEYCIKYAILPDRRFRWCTQKFKVEPVGAYYERPALELIGFDAGEAKRRLSITGKIGVEQDFPLIAAGIDRQGCIDLIKRHGLPVPPKSGCYFCPFQGRRQWQELRKIHPELFCKAQKLEQMTNERRRAVGKGPVYFRDIPLGDLIQVKDSRGRRALQGQTEAFDSFDRPPCRCGL